MKVTKRDYLITPNKSFTKGMLVISKDKSTIVLVTTPSDDSGYFSGVCIWNTNISHIGNYLADKNTIHYKEYHGTVIFVTETQSLTL